MAVEWDVIIVGAGPAGSRAAELIARDGLRVMLCDPKAPWEKPCGGGLTAAALVNTPALRELEDRTQSVHEILTIAPSGASVVVPLRHPYQVVSRAVLAAWGLGRATRAGAVFNPAAIVKLRRLPDGWVVEDRNGISYRARRLIGADGAASRVRGVVAPGLKPELAPTRVVYPTVGSPPGRAVFQFLPRADGYVWDFPRPGHHSVGIGVAPRTFNRAALDEALDQFQLAETGSSMNGAEHHGAVIATSAWSSGTFGDLGSTDYALVGDAAGLADPATGEGIDYAFRSAALAASRLNAETGFAAYPSAARQAFGAEMWRGKLVRRGLYLPAVADRLIRGARHSPRAALLLAAMCDAINEHGSLSGALWRAIRGTATDRRVARAICECPDGIGASDPIRG